MFVLAINIQHAWNYEARSSSCYKRCAICLAFEGNWKFMEIC